MAVCLITWVTTAHGPLHEQIVQLTTELEKNPNDAERLVRRGELLRLHGLFSEARLDFQRVRQLRPDDVTNHLHLGRLELDARETNAALSHLEAWVTARPAVLEGQLALAKALMLAQRPGDAAKHFSEAIRLDPEPRPEWFLDRAKAQIAAGAPATNVLAGLDEAIVLYGPLPALQLFAVDLEMKRGEPDAALARIDALAARAERKERWLFRRGELLLQAGRTSAAKAEFAATLKSLDALPDKLRRAWVATELRQQTEARLAAIASGREADGNKP